MTSPAGPSSFSRTVGEYLDALACAAPTPGGGSAAGLSGAMGCALAEMVCSLTLRKKLDSSKVAVLERTRVDLTTCRQQLLELANADELAYAGYRAGTSMPKNTLDEREQRKDSIAKSLARATEVPLQTARVAVLALQGLSTVARLGSKHALADLSTAAFLLEAAANGALANAAANMELMAKSGIHHDFESRRHEVAQNLESSANAVRHTLASRAES